MNEKSSESAEKSSSFLSISTNNDNNHKSLPNTSNKSKATGSGRNKVALKPGHGLLGWIRFISDAKNRQDIQPKPNNVPAQNIITLKELNKHDQPDDCWIAIHGKVYNITKYLDYHPGGVDELMKAAGQNATEMFDDVHPWVNYENLLAQCLIGRLPGL